MLYTSTHAATIFKVSTETIRNWSEEFSRHLSITANPGKGRTRNFTVEDMQVLSLISQMKKEGANFEEIHASLAIGQRGTPPDLMVEDVQAILSGEQEKRLNLEIDYLKRSLREALARAEKAEVIHSDNIRLKAHLEAAEKRITELNNDMQSTSEIQQKSQLELMKRIEELSKEIGEAYARGVMDTLERRGDLPRKDRE